MICTPASSSRVFLSTPSARRATLVSCALSGTTLFLSTPSARRATWTCPQPPRNCCYFYPRPPRGGRPRPGGHPQPLGVISIHALREEGDVQRQLVREVGRLFLSTPSARRATPSNQLLADDVQISIHALREEGDRCKGAVCTPAGISIHALREEGDLYDLAAAGKFADFYPRPPRGGRPMLARISSFMQRFLSTPSARRATQREDAADWWTVISIHALREEGDALPAGVPASVRHFYPRPPRGGRQGFCCINDAAPRISIHALREEGDDAGIDYNALDLYFYPRPPRGGRLGVHNTRYRAK